MNVNMHLSDEMEAAADDQPHSKTGRATRWFTISDGEGGEVTLFPTAPHQLEEIATAMLAQAQDWRVAEGGGAQFGKALAAMNSPHENSSGPDVPAPEQQPCRTCWK